MEFLRMYLGELTGVVLVLVLLFVAEAIASHYVAPDRQTVRKMVRRVRNICLAATLAAFLMSLIPSLAVNQAPKARIDRSGAVADQKAFELRHSDRSK